MQIKVKCTNCKRKFPFQHPSVKSAADMAHLHISCPKCKTVLEVSKNSIRMDPAEVFFTQ